jgi:hypothetical protein
MVESLGFRTIATTRMEAAWTPRTGTDAVRTQLTDTRGNSGHFRLELIDNGTTAKEHSSMSLFRTV